MSFRGMVVTVGTSCEPVVKTLDEHAPDHVLFVVSAESRKTVEDEVRVLVKKNPEAEYLEITDLESLKDCHMEINKGMGNWIKERNLDRSDVGIDYTGGIKVMSIALALAAIDHSIDRFVYVGGAKRDYDNRGIVIEGFERIVSGQNPLRARAVREIERANWLLENFYPEAAAQVLKEARDVCDEEYKSRLNSWINISDALDCADRFQFNGAVRIFTANRIKFSEAFDEAVFGQLDAIFENGWKKIKESLDVKGKTPVGSEIFHELLANAERRAKQGRYDDAVGRLYRAIELRGQQLASEKLNYGIELGVLLRKNVSPETYEKITKKLKLDKTRNDGKHDLGLKKLYDLLRIERGGQYADVNSRLGKHLDVRNKSLLAHGLKPVSKGAFWEFWNDTLDVLNIKKSDIPRWPEIRMKLPS